MESSVAGTHDEMLQVLKEKMRLEGQLEALSAEANQVENEFLYLANYVNVLINFQGLPTLVEVCFVKTLLNYLHYRDAQGDKVSKAVERFKKKGQKQSRVINTELCQ